MFTRNEQRALGLFGAALALGALTTGCGDTSQPSGGNLSDETIAGAAIRSNIVERETLLASTKTQNIYIVPANTWKEWLTDFPTLHPNEEIVDSQIGGVAKRGEGSGNYYSSYSIPTAMTVVTKKLASITTGPKQY